VAVALGRTVVLNGYLIAWDLSLPLSNSSFLAYYWPLWSTTQNSFVGFALPYLAYPTNFLAYVLVQVGLLNVQGALKLMVLGPIFVGGNVFYYFAQWLIRRSNLAVGSRTSLLFGLMGIVIFLANPASTNLLVQELSTFQAMTLVPALIFLFERTYSTNSLGSLVATALLIAAMSVNIHVIIILCIIVIAMLVTHLSVKNIGKSLLSIALAALYSGFWIGPIFSANAPASSGFVVTKLFLQPKDALSVLTGLAWFSEPFVKYPRPLNLMWLIMPALAVIPIQYIKDRIAGISRLTLSLYTMLLIAIAMLMGSTPPFGIFYSWVIDNLGGYAAIFRVTYFWYGLFSPVTSVLATLGCATWYSVWSQRLVGTTIVQSKTENELLRHFSLPKSATEFVRSVEK
jgi:hypothetical protein